MNSHLATARRILLGCVFFCGLNIILSAQPVLTGVSIYSADADGLFNGVTFWDTRGPSSGANDLYAFTGTGESRVWLNSGTSDETLNFNYSLTPGTHTITVHGGSMSFGDYLGMNTWFSLDALAPSTITAVGEIAGDGTFAAVDDSISTYRYGSASNVVAGSGSLSYLSGGYLVTLTGFSPASGDDLVGTVSIGADGSADIAATLTFSVTAVPEPANFALWLAGFALFALAMRRRRVSSV